MIATAAPSDSQVQDEFCDMLSEITGRLRHFLREYNPELRDELVAEAVALAWSAFRSARSIGKEVQPTTLAWYCARSVRSGRRLAGTSTTDAMSERAQREVGRVQSIEASRNLYDLLVDRRWRWPLIDVCGVHMDWSDFRDRCTDRERRIVDAKLAGEKQTMIARDVGVTPARICQSLKELRGRWSAMSVA